MFPIYETEVIECRGLSELTTTCKNLGEQGYEVKAVTESQPNINVTSYYTVVFQREVKEA